MPGMNGVELVEQARRLRPSLPVLIITGFVEAAQLSRVPDGVEILRKPFQARQLASRVAALIGTAPRSAAHHRGDPQLQEHA